MLWGYRLQTKIIIVVLTIVTLCVLVSAIFSLYRVKSIAEEQLDAVGIFSSQTLATFCVENLLAWDYPALQLSIEHAAEYDSHILAIEIFHKNNLVASYQRNVTEEEIEDGMKYSAPVVVETLGGTRELGAVKIVLSKKKYYSFYAQQIYSLLLLGLVLGLGNTFLIYLTVSKMILRPLRRIEEEAKIIGEGDLEHQINVKSKDEIGRLAQAINTMTKNLKMAIKDAEESKKTIEWEKNKTRAALISLSDGLIVFDKEKKIILVNPEAERILNIKEKEVVNKEINQISASANLNKLYNVLGGKIEWTGRRYELILGKQFKRFFQVSITPISVDKEIIGLMVILHDITRGKEVERLKTEFVSIAAHQLRTPLSATKWILRMLLDGDVGKLSKEQTDFLEKGYQSNERMITLINDLLNVAHIEEGRFIYRPSFDLLEDIAQRSIDGLKDAAKQRDIEIIFNRPKNGLLKKVKIDGKKIELVVQNLLNNAIRFTKPGGKVVISVEYDKINAKVTVRDTGVGIPDNQQSRIFTKFFRADNVIKMETQGTGLGLFICKNIINAHGGKIWFKSKENKGTTFYFTIPLNSKL